MHPNIQDNGWQDFVAKCAKFNDPRDMETFFDVFLTMSEKEELAKRFNIIKELLLTTKTQREIAKDLKVSIANVSRGANVIKTYPSNLKELLKI